MTRDAKIGLLLGLFFIFVIAFIINGLPGSAARQDNNQLTTQYLEELKNYSPVLASKQLETARKLEQQNEALPTVLEAAADQQGVRDQVPLPAATTTASPQQPTPPEPSQNAPQQAGAAGTAAPAVSRSQFYVVQEGDSLSIIARKFYGPEEGNKKANVERIFEANRKIIESPDRLLVGQKLLVPPLSSGQSGQKVAALPQPELFETVSSIGRKSAANVPAAATGAHREYIVKEGDSLWSIAAEQLGDGARYTEIARLNADILVDENSLEVAIRLKLPDK